MSMHIKMKDEYTQVTTYHGKLDDKYHFLVEVLYGSSLDAKDNHYISIEFIADGELYNGKPKKYWRKAEDKVRDFVTKWLFAKEKENEQKNN